MTAMHLHLKIDARDLYHALAGRRLYDGALLEVWWQGGWRRGLFSSSDPLLDRPQLVGWGGPPIEITPAVWCREAGSDQAPDQDGQATPRPGWSGHADAPDPTPRR